MNLANRERPPAGTWDESITGVGVSLALLLKNGTAVAGGKQCGQILDVIVRLKHNEYAEIVLIVVKQGTARKFFAADQILDIRRDAVELKSDQSGITSAPPEGDEISLRSDILSQRVIDLARGALVKVYDVRLARHGHGWAAIALDVHRGRWFGLGSHASHPARDWRDFLPLSPLRGLTVTPSSPSWIGRLKPAQIADLIETATAEEQDKLLEQVHSDPELEADVFEELEEDSQAQLFKSLSDEEIADVLSRMRADDAADAVMELAQERRHAVLDLLPASDRTKVMTLLGYNEATAGGLMGTEFLAMPEEATVADALRQIREATTKQPEALTTIHCVAAGGKLTGVLGIVQALQADPRSSLVDAADHHIVAASPEDEISTVVARMADFNLLSLPVVDEDGIMLGIVTVDDALEAALPTHWGQR